MADSEDVVTALRGRTPDEIGGDYLEALRSEDEADKWIVERVWFGNDDDFNDLDDELRWQLVMAALNACPDDDDDLWLLGDGPFDQLADRPGMVQRLHAERPRNPKLERLFNVMIRYLEETGEDQGAWWVDPRGWRGSAT